MTESRVVPSAMKILFADYWCMLLGLAPVICLLLGVAAVYSGRVDVAAAIAQFGSLGRDDVVLVIAVLFLPMCIPLLIRRMLRIRHIFREGMEADAEIVFFRRFRDRGRIEFEFEHADAIIRAGNAVHLTRAVQSLNIGQHVTVVYLPGNPKAAFIREIFH